MGVTQHCPSKRDIPKYGGEGHNVATWFYAIDEKRWSQTVTWCAFIDFRIFSWAASGSCKNTVNLTLKKMKFMSRHSQRQGMLRDGLWANHGNLICPQGRDFGHFDRSFSRFEGHLSTFSCPWWGFWPTNFFPPGGGEFYLIFFKENVKIPTPWPTSHPFPGA